jgi:hypothetical protein
MPTPIINPTANKFKTPNDILRWAQSVYKSIQGGISFALGKGSDNNGVYNSFDMTNGDGIMVRIGAAGGSELIKWNSGTGQATIPVNTLGRKPTGWILCDIDRAASIYRSAPPTSSSLILKTSDTTCSITVWIF